MALDAAPVQELDGFTLRQRIPPGPGPHPVVLMLHGWTGDEDVMWIFASRLPKEAWLIAPRGLYPAPQSGFGWTPRLSSSWPQVEDFRPAIRRLLEWLKPENFPGAALEQIDMVGFSQGAALGFALGLLYPPRVRALAALSGFVPDGALPFIENRPLQGKAVFLAHGTQDTIVPVERARAARDLLQQAGADVSYCEDDVGHKLSATCFRSLEVFFEDLG
jgi:phospholipase/carboxylesterase